MDYQSFRQFRDELLKSRAPLRLDCMNPSKALSAWVPRVPGSPANDREAIRRALAAWSGATGMIAEVAVVGTGVRDLLGRLLAKLGREADEMLVRSS